MATIQKRRQGTLSVVPGKGVQARIIRNKATRSRFFRFSLYPGEASAALEAAKAMAEAWLNALAAGLPEPDRAGTRKSNKSTDLMAGVSLSRYVDRRGVEQARYQAVYYTDSRRRVKSFMLGPVDQLTKRDYGIGRKVAEGFRVSFEKAQASRVAFVPESWVDWREAFGVEFKWRDGRTGFANPSALEQAIEHGGLRT